MCAVLCPWTPSHSQGDEAWAWRARTRMYRSRAARRLLADRYPGLVATLEADAEPPLGEEHVVVALVVQVEAQVGEPGHTQAGIDQHAHERGIAAIRERRALAGLEKSRQLIVAEERLGLLADLRPFDPLHGIGVRAFFLARQPAEEHPKVAEVHGSRHGRRAPLLSQQERADVLGVNALHVRRHVLTDEEGVQGLHGVGVRTNRSLALGCGFERKLPRGDERSKGRPAGAGEPSRRPRSRRASPMLVTDMLVPPVNRCDLRPSCPTLERSW